MKLSIKAALLAAVMFGTGAQAMETVVWWDFLGGGDGVRMKKLIEDFNTEHKDAIEIQATTLEWGVPFYSKVQTSAAGGEGPDMMTYHASRIPLAVSQESLTEITAEDMATMGLSADSFAPATWEAQAGEPIRIILVNKGKVDHELVIGTEKEIIAHAKEMASPGAKGHHHTNEISAKPGQQAELVWTFKKPGQYAMACFEPGHYEAGMKGAINVVAN